jgi:hypothetical protein
MSFFIIAADDNGKGFRKYFLYSFFFYSFGVEYFR